MKRSRKFYIKINIEPYLNLSRFDKNIKQASKPYSMMPLLLIGLLFFQAKNHSLVFGH